jgi:fructokinase
MSSIAVLGEALIDLHMVTGARPQGERRPMARSYTAQPGGSPFNVAIGLARLGHRTQFVGRFAQDALGGILRRHAQQSGVVTDWSGGWPGPTPAALFDLGADGSARYEFHLGDVRSSMFAASDADRIDPTSLDAVHFGSIASWLPGSSEPALAAVARLRESGVFVSYDPNIRAELILDRLQTVRLIEQAAAGSDMIKASEEDLTWLYPGCAPSRVADQWLTRGAVAVIVTRGSQGADCYTANGAVHGVSEPVDVVDTVGAGDAFMAGLLDGLAATGALNRVGLAKLLASRPATQRIVDTACAHAAATCAVPGADPPWRSIPVAA